MIKYFGKTRIYKKAVSLFGSDVPIMKYCSYKKYHRLESFEFTTTDYDYHIKIVIASGYCRICRYFIDDEGRFFEVNNNLYHISSF